MPSDEIIQEFALAVLAWSTKEIARHGGQTRLGNVNDNPNVGCGSFEISLRHQMRVQLESMRLRSDAGWQENISQPRVHRDVQGQR